MATENRAVLNAVGKSFRKIFLDKLRESGESELLKLAMRVPSNSPVEVYDYLMDFATMKKWEGERKLSDSRADDFEIRNDVYEATIKVKRMDVQFDRLGMYEHRIANLVDAYRRKRRREILKLLTDNPKTYDGQPLFSATHPNVGTGVDQSNYGGATFALTGANYDAAIEQMMLLVDHQGEPLDVTPNTLIIGPKLKKVARDLFGKMHLSTGESNPHYGDGPDEIIVDNMLGTSEAWYLLDAEHSLKPFIVQDVGSVDFDGVTDPDSEYVFMNDAYLYGTRAIWGMGAGVWQVIYGANF